LRRSNAHSYGDSNGFAIGDAYADFNTNSNSSGYSDGNVDADTNANSDGFGIGNAYVPAWGHTRAMGYRCTWADCPVSCWWNHRWDLLLRLRWPNLDRRLLE
jgi:hypothetical protein